MLGLSVPTVLHLHSTFKLGGKEARDVDLINHFGDRFRHVIVSAEPGGTAAADLIDPGIPFRVETPPLAGPMRLGRLRALGRYLAQGAFDLVLSFNFGAMDGVLANRIWGGRPLVHHEDGFNEDEVHRQRPERVAYRRLALPGARHLVVPSTRLEAIARQSWHIRPPKLRRIPNGIDIARFARGPAAGALPGFTRGEQSVVIGTVAGLRRVKNLPLLVRGFAMATARLTDIDTRLVIVGSGPEEPAIQAEAERLGVTHRLFMPGFLPHPHRYVGHFDIFALSSDSEQFPLSLVEAMAAGVPAVCTNVGDIAHILPDGSAGFLAPAGDEAALADALCRLIADPGLRRAAGEANRARAAAEFARDAMIKAYEDVYSSTMGCRAHPSEAVQDTRP